MTAYIDEIRKVNTERGDHQEIEVIDLKILETMPQTNEVLKFTQLIGPFYEFVDDHAQQNGSLVPVKKKSHQTNLNKKKPTKSNSYVNGTGESKSNLHGFSQTTSFFFR